MVILISDENKVGKNMSTNSIYKLSGRVDGSNAGQYQFEISNLVKTRQGVNPLQSIYQSSFTSAVLAYVCS